MDKKIRFEKLTEEDIGQTKSLIREYLRWIDIDLCFQNIEEEMEHFPIKYSEPEGAFYVAKDGNRVVGCVGIKKIGKDTCEMKRLFVNDEYKGLGIGKRLIEIIIEEAKEKRYAKMRLDTLKRMDRAYKIYKAFGFKEIKQYVENPIEDAIFMEKTL